VDTLHSKQRDEFVSRARIRDVVERYFYALDSDDMTALASCFTPDVQAIFQKGRPEERVNNGRDGLLRQLAHNGTHSSARIHTLSSLYICRLDDDTAAAVSHAIATVVKGQRVMVRGLRYDDEFSLQDGEWRISRRVHMPLWQYDAQRTELEGAKALEAPA
jgi:uncharacterized protein (TIGR02246 family)